MALGALPVLVTAWSLGMRFGLGSALISILFNLLVNYGRNGLAGPQDLLALQYLAGFALLAITGMFVGHLKDLQTRSNAELQSLTENNQKLVRLSQALDATNQLAADLILSEDWMKKVPSLLARVGSAAGSDHLFLFQLIGDGSNHYAGLLNHYWPEAATPTTDKDQKTVPDELYSWIELAEPDQPLIGVLSDLEDHSLKYLSLQDEGSFVVFPIFTTTSLWGFIGFESNDPEKKWDTPEINTFRSIAHTLGSVIYRKLIEENLNLRVKELDSLQQASKNITSSNRLETNLNTVLSQIFEITPAYNTSIYLKDGPNLDFFISLSRDNQQALPFSHPGEADISQLTANTDQDLFIPDLSLFGDVSVAKNGKREAVTSLVLKAASEIIGVLNIWYETARESPEEERTILRLFADQLAAGIINFQYLEQEREQRHLADSLRKANLQLSDNLELRGVLESLLDQVLTLVTARDANIFLYDGELLEFGAVKYAENSPQQPIHPPTDDGVIYKAARNAERILVEDVQAKNDLKKTWMSGSLVSLPLIFHKSVIGVMNVSFIDPGLLDDNMLQLLDLLSNQAAIAINNARTFEAEREQRRLAQALQNTGRVIQSSLDLEVVLDQILTQIETVIPYHAANLILVENGEMRVVRQQGFKGEEGEDLGPYADVSDLSRFTTLVKMADSKTPMIIPDIDQSSDWIKTETTRNVASWAGAPILDGDHVLGFLSLNNNTPGFYTAEHADILSAFASQASIALIHARLHKKIQELAITDPLTEILNRRGLERWGQYEIDRAKRFNSPLSAIFFDLDKFKGVNDTFGHDIGDEVLRQVVDCCQSVIRSIDIFSRVGGEEFLILLPETSLPVAIQVAERLRQTVADHCFHGTASEVTMTISLGVVELNEEIDTLAELMITADRYMYQSKNSGRDRISHP